LALELSGLLPLTRDRRRVECKVKEISYWLAKDWGCMLVSKTTPIRGVAKGGTWVNVPPSWIEKKF